MPDINLLPITQKQKRVVLSLLTYMTIGFVIVIVLIGGFILTLTTIRLTISDKINFYDSQITSLKKQLTAFQSLEQDVAQINTNLALANTFLNQQMRPNNVLNIVSGHIGQTIVLSSVAVTKRAADPKSVAVSDIQITINGGANSRSDIIDFKRALEGEPTLSGVTYTISADAGDPANPTKIKTAFTFSIIANYQMSSEKKP